MGDQIQKIAAEGGAPEYADRTPILMGIITTVFKGFPGALQENAMLRIGYLRFTRRHAEERGIKAIDIFKEAGCTHMVFVYAR
jgi:hypothetical protein